MLGEMTPLLVLPEGGCRSQKVPETAGNLQCVRSFLFYEIFIFISIRFQFLTNHFFQPLLRTGFLLGLIYTYIHLYQFYILSDSCPYIILTILY